MSIGQDNSDGGLTVFGEATSIRGRIRGEGDLEVRGRFDGELDVRGDVTLAEGSLVSASLVRGTRVVIRGALVGDVVGYESITLDETARVVGNLRSVRIVIALGAQIRGELDMTGESTEPPTKKVAQAAQRPSARTAPSQAQPARTAARMPPPPARPVVVTRKAPPPLSPPAHAPAPVVAPVAPFAPVSAAPASEEPVTQRKAPPPPVVPAIKKGAKAAAKKKGAP
jgi:cytoskeletal protein CcmA (bactofilin family)